MDADRFDALTKRLAATGASRRRLLRGLGGGLLAVLGGKGADAAPACRGAGHPCEGNLDCCLGLACAASGPGAARRCTPPTTTTTTAPPTTTTTTTTPPSCPAGTCQAGDDSCHGSFLCSATNPNCACFQSVEGDTVCVDLTNASCNNTCSSSAQCRVGASCVQLSGPACCEGAGLPVCIPCCAG